jgi:hypothetical protein
MGKRPSHNRFCSFLRYHIFIIHRYTMLYCQRVITSSSFILSVNIIGSLHKFFNFFSTFSTIFIIFKKQNDSIDRISFYALIKPHFLLLYTSLQLSFLSSSEKVSKALSGIEIQFICLSIYRFLNFMVPLGSFF